MLIYPPKAGLIDCGVNLLSADQDIAAYLNACQHAGLGGIIATGTSLNDSQTLGKLHKQITHAQWLGYTVGQHPHYANQITPEDVEGTLAHLRAEDFLAIGECGLDYYRMLTPKTQQLAIFEAFLAYGSKYFPQHYFFLHERQAFDDMYAILQKYPNVPFLIHSFTGSKSQLRAYLDLGAYVSINGYCMDSRRNQDLLEALAILPLSRLLIETDAPYLIPRVEKLRPWGKNHSKHLPIIAQFLHEHFFHKTTFDTFEQTLISNTKTVFNLV